MTLAQWIADWRQARSRRRAQSEARHLAHEARRILKKKGYRIPEAVARDVAAAADEVEGSLDGSDPERTRQALSRLDEKMDEHLAFARKSSVREYAESIGVAVAIALLLRAFVVEAFQIPSGSMIPTLEVGDHIFVSKFSYGIGIPFTDKKLVKFGLPKRGDIIVFKYPLDPSTDYIKRVVGLPGDKVEVRNDEVFINGRPMPRHQVKGPCSYDDDGALPVTCERWIESLDGREHLLYQQPDRSTNSPPVQIPEGNVFVMGDNRDNSRDSREWGTVRQELIKGRALIVWWSRGPIAGDFALGSIPEWFQALRWRRFFSLVT
jgi:signal peptidase I